MKPRRFTRRLANVHMMAGLSLLLFARQGFAQTQRPTIPIVVAQASFLQTGPFGSPTYLDGQTPADWPAALVPPRTKILGSAVIGDTAFFRMRTAVFEFPAGSNPRETLETMLTLSGFGPLKAALESAHEGGFMQTAPAQATAGKYCKGSTLAVFTAVDPAHAPLDFAVDLLDGEAGRQSCLPQHPPMNPGRFPVAIPPLVAPTGVMSDGGGGSSSWGGLSGEMRTSLRTTMPADSILANYTAQWVSADWKPEGRAGIADGVGVQRFTFHDGKDVWSAALFVMATGDRRDVRLQVSRIE